MQREHQKEALTRAISKRPKQWSDLSSKIHWILSNQCMKNSFDCTTTNVNVLLRANQLRAETWSPKASNDHLLETVLSTTLLPPTTDKRFWKSSITSTFKILKQDWREPNFNLNQAQERLSKDFDDFFPLSLPCFLKNGKLKF